MRRRGVTPLVGLAPVGGRPRAIGGGVVTDTLQAAGSPRASWHRRVGLLPPAYLLLIVAVGFAHPFLPDWRWLAIHMLLLGAVTNAIVVWSAHFTAAVLRVPTPLNRRA